MEKNEAIQQIESITEVIESGNKIFFSGKKLIGWGILLLLIPIIEYVTQGMTFGYQYLSNPAVNIIVHIFVYYVIFNLIIKIFCRSKTKKVFKSSNTVMKKALAVHTPIIYTMFATIVVLSLIGQGVLVFPVVFLFLGILFNLFGRFTNNTVLNISWSYIILGLVYLVLTTLSLNYLWLIFMIYLGVTYIIMGISIKNTER